MRYKESFKVRENISVKKSRLFTFCVSKTAEGGEQTLAHNDIK